MSHKKKIIYVGLIAFLLTFVLGAVYAFEQVRGNSGDEFMVFVPSQGSETLEREPEDRSDKEQPSQNQEPVFCIMDVKQCQDGSYVSRQGPDCEFAPCPSE